MKEESTKMSGYGLFSPAVLGMSSQSHRLNVIGTNVANVNTGGYKRTDTEFSTVLSDKFFQHNDVGGTVPNARPRYDLQGLVRPSDRNTDVAIVGDGFFAVQPDFNSTTTIQYTRDGAFEISTVDGQTSTVPGEGINPNTGVPYTLADGVVNDSNGNQVNPVTVNNGYLTDKNGNFVLGIPANTDGTFTLGAASPMRVDQYAFTNNGQATTTAELDLNLPASDSTASEAQTYSLQVYDSNFNARTVNFNFRKSQTTNGWNVNFTADNLTTGSLTGSSPIVSADSSGTSTDTNSQLNITGGATSTIQLIGTGTTTGISNAFNSLAVGQSITLANTASNNGTYTITAISNDGSTLTVGSTLTTETTDGDVSSPQASRMTFNSLGALQTPSNITLNATWSDGATSAIAVDFSDMQQFDSEFTIFRTDQNGFGQADIEDFNFNSAGEIVGRFSDGTERAIYKVPLYNFTNPNGLEASNGMVFSETPDSGAATAFFADSTIRAEFLPNSVEISNVDIGAEFTKMIQTQTAYNLNATTFRTIDEMTTVARDLKA